MRQNTIRKIVFFAISALTFGGAALQSALACTDARVVAKDGSVLTARSMELNIPLDSQLVVRARGARLQSPAPDGTQGDAWTGKYGYVYISVLKLDVPADGMNERGLSFGALYLPGYAAYEEIGHAARATAMSNVHLGAWILSQFGSVEEVKAALPKIHVWGEPLAAFGKHYVPLHYVIHDASGKSLILEWVGGKLTTYDDAAGVVTNSPPYDWQMTNLRNYVNLSPNDRQPVKISSVSVMQTGDGSGLLGIPGDPTPPSRLIQTAFALNFATTPKDAREALVLAQKLMNRVDRPKGLTRDSAANPGDWTQWAVFRDHVNLRYYYRTYDDATLRMIDLKKIDFSQQAPVRRMSIENAEPTVLEIAPATIPAS
ncbi:linear amide C-N hydrolase [Burkholderia sp. LMG 32019]|uniref:linear amide C-N hydrolase n=1 Tax=Burkholderia sp. LMG 32019 TaxID=3158173 RepID=UPI003C2EFF9A